MADREGEGIELVGKQSHSIVRFLVKFRGAHRNNIVYDAIARLIGLKLGTPTRFKQQPDHDRIDRLCGRTLALGREGSCRIAARANDEAVHGEKCGSIPNSASQVLTRNL